MRFVSALTIGAMTLGLALPRPANAQAVAALDACMPGAGAASTVIRGDAALAAQDLRLRVTYRYLMDFAPFWAADIISRDQAEWVGTRTACGTDANCLGEAYRGRLIGLFGWMECLRTELPMEG
ncbi:MAG: hypothetical protein IT534_09595 [Bauldia sp.]|nr:hypothetical protein [Bauldia sp.]